MARAERRWGGAIYNAGTLTLYDVMFRGNVGPRRAGRTWAGTAASPARAGAGGGGGRRRSRREGRETRRNSVGTAAWAARPAAPGEAAPRERG